MEYAVNQSGKIALKLEVTHLNAEQPEMGYAAKESLGKVFLPQMDHIIGWIMF
jgi:hypothetical protein